MLKSIVSLCFLAALASMFSFSSAAEAHGDEVLIVLSVALGVVLLGAALVIFLVGATTAATVVAGLSGLFFVIGIGSYFYQRSDTYKHRLEPNPRPKEDMEDTLKEMRPADGAILIPSDILQS